MQVFDAPVTEIDPMTLYRILALRTDVFVVEQQAAYRELDGRDLEPHARQLWIERDDDVVATLRLLLDPDGSARIGRVATHLDARGAGLAAQLMRRALEVTDAPVVVLDAQSHLAGWYARFGFAVAGDEYTDEDGIPHVPMLLGRETDLLKDPSSAG